MITRATLITAGVVVWAHVAPLRAEPDTVERALRDVALVDDDARGFHAQGFAQLGADQIEASGAVGGELRYQGRCDYVRVGAQARIGASASARVSAEQWASVCLPITVMEIEHHLEWDVHPTLLAPLGLRPELNRRETLRFHWRPLRASLPRLLAAMERGEAAKQGEPPPPPRTPAEEAQLPQGDVILMDVEVRHTQLWDASGRGDAAYLDQVEAIPIEYVNGPFSLIIASGGGEFNDAGAIIHVWGVKLEGLALGPVRASGGLGIASGSAGAWVSSVEREIAVTAPRGLVALAIGDGATTAEVRATHDVSMAPGGFVTVDARLVAALDHAAGATRLTVDAAVARTTAHVPGRPTPAAGLTGGGAVAIARRLARHLDASARVEVARSFYATPMALRDLTPAWGVSAFAGLQGTVGR
ncbi:MAG: hypothetical protein R3B06_12370 [Kofleriaceae bacterium]